MTHPLTVDANFPWPPEQLAAAIGEFLIAYAQAERALLYRIESAAGWTPDQPIDWGTASWKNSALRREFDALLAPKPDRDGHHQLARTMLAWLEEHHPLRQILTFGALVSVEGYAPYFYHPAINGERHTLETPDPDRYRRLAAQAHHLARELDALIAETEQG